MALGGATLAIIRCGFAEDTFGWIVVASINQAVPCYWNLLYLYFDSTISRSNAIFPVRAFHARETDLLTSSSAPYLSVRI